MNREKQMMRVLALLTGLIGFFAFLAVAQSVPQAASDTMVLVQGGWFMMGDTLGEGDEYERPLRRVALSAFMIGKYEVTQCEWQELMGNNPSRFTNDLMPVAAISWKEVVMYCNKRSQKEGLVPCYRFSGDHVRCIWNANGYRLPTEAEWEYAAREGHLQGARPKRYAGSDSVDEVAWCFPGSKCTVHPVGQKMPNRLGIHDMSGNVREWCWDMLGRYGKDAETDPRGPSSGAFHIVRGGSYDQRASKQRVTSREAYPPSGHYGDVGFRLARSVPASRTGLD